MLHRQTDGKKLVLQFFFTTKFLGPQSDADPVQGKSIFVKLYHSCIIYVRLNQYQNCADIVKLQSRSKSSPGSFELHSTTFQSIPIQNQRIWTRS